MPECMVCRSSDVASKCVVCGSIVEYSSCTASPGAEELQAQVKTLEAALATMRADARTILRAFTSFDSLALYDRLFDAGLSSEDSEQVRSLSLCEDGGQLLESIRRIAKP